MAIKPILFNTEMVRASLDGRKDATRRIVKGFIPDDAVWGYTAFTPKGYISCRGTSTRAKCKQLGVDWSDGIEFSFGGDEE